MKKIVIGVFALTLVIIGCLLSINFTGKESMAKSKGNSQTVRVSNSLTNTTKSQYDLTPDKLAEEIKTGKTVTVYFFSPTCVHCQHTTPIVTATSKKLALPLEKLNLLQYRDGWTQFKIEGTPTLVVFKHGVEVSRLVGEQDAQTFSSWFQTYSMN